VVFSVANMAGNESATYEAGVKRPSRLGLSRVQACLDTTLSNFAKHCCRMYFGVEGNQRLELGATHAIPVVVVNCRRTAQSAEASRPA
jgi:hypothetical protein